MLKGAYMHVHTVLIEEGIVYRLDRVFMYMYILKTVHGH